MFIFVYIYYYRSYTYLINYRKGDIKRQLDSMYLIRITTTMKALLIKKRPTSEEIGLHFIGKSSLLNFQFDIDLGQVQINSFQLQ